MSSLSSQLQRTVLRGAERAARRDWEAFCRSVRGRSPAAIRAAGKRKYSDGFSDATVEALSRRERVGLTVALKTR